MAKKILPWLWFNGNAEEAVAYYKSVFPDVEIGDTTRYPAGAPMEGEVLTIEFRIFDQDFGAINAGPEFSFNESISFSVDCADQKEIDYYWNTLTADGGEESMCGWLKDKYGLSWQIVPARFDEMLKKGTPAQASAITMALFQMQKIDLAAIEDAFASA